MQLFSVSLPLVNSEARIDMCSVLLNHRGMQTNDEIRRARLALLIAEAGSAAKFAERAGKAPPQISQWINASPDSKTKRPRTMSDDAARELEKRLGLPRGWMDQPVVTPADRSARDSDAVPALPSALAAVANALSSVPPGKRQALLGVLAAYASDPAGESNSLAYLQKELTGGASAPAPTSDAPRRPSGDEA